MAIPNEALQKLALEIESQANSAQREINVVKVAIANKQRDARMLDLTSTEIKQLDSSAKLYEGVGKMFLFSEKAEVETRIQSDVSEIKTDITNLNKKLHYLEMTQKNSRDHIDKIMGAKAGKP